MPNFSLNKVFIEAIYSDSLLFNDMRILQEIIENFKDNLPESNYDDQTKTLVLVNSEKQCNIMISKNRIAIDSDSPNSFDEFKNFSNQALNVIIPKLAITRFNRVGMRSFRGIEKKNNGEAYKSVWKNFIKVKEEDLNELGTIHGCGVNFILTGQEYNVNLGISPNFYQVLKIVNGNVQSQVNKWQLMVDSDVYLNPPINVEKVLNSFVDDVIKINENQVNNFISKASNY